MRRMIAAGLTAAALIVAGASSAAAVIAPEGDLPAQPPAPVVGVADVPTPDPSPTSEEPQPVSNPEPSADDKPVTAGPVEGTGTPENPLPPPPNSSGVSNVPNGPARQ